MSNTLDNPELLGPLYRVWQAYLHLRWPLQTFDDLSRFWTSSTELGTVSPVNGKCSKYKENCWKIPILYLVLTASLIFASDILLPLPSSRVPHITPLQISPSSSGPPIMPSRPSSWTKILSSSWHQLFLPKWYGNYSWFSAFFQSL